MNRVSVVGNAGSGKSTLAHSLASEMGARYLELDSIFHLPGWVEPSPEDFRHHVGQVVAKDAWVIDGNYSAVRDLVWERADTVVWVDPPHPLVMVRVIRRTLRRTVTQEELWNGNREPWSNLLSRDPSRSIIAWSWAQRNECRARYGAATTDPAWAHLDFIRVRTSDDRRRLLRMVAPNHT